MLELQSVSFEVDNHQILRDLNLYVKAGSFVAITGPNGGGKTSLAKIIMGVIKPKEGKILFEGQDITNLEIDQRAGLGIGFAFQSPVRFKGISIREIFSYAAGRNLKHAEINNYLSEVGLDAEEYINRELGADLSGGEIKRIEIAMLLAKNPKLMIFDEPEAGIDLWSFEHIAKLFKSLKKDKTKSILIISHQKRILELANEIIIMKKGSVSVRGASKDVLPKILEGENVK